MKNRFIGYPVKKLSKLNLTGLMAMLLVTISVSFVHAQTKAMPEQIFLWRGEIPNGPGPQGQEIVSEKGSYTNIFQPRLIVHRPQHPNGMAMLVISGGGYAHIELGKESSPAAKWMQVNGITAFELIYRLPEEGWSDNNVAFQDGQRAMKLIRSMAGRFGINPNQIGVMGFSAGGHLAGMLETQFDTPFYKPVDAIDRLSARPDFAALLYPVITMMPPFDHTHSEKVIIGKHPSRAQQKNYSVELHVNGQTPPTFLAQALDDPISNVENSKLMYAALQRQGIASEIHLFPVGGHGWGMGDPGTQEQAWPELFKTWVKQNNFWH